MQPTAPFVWLALIAAPWVQSGLAQASNQVVFEKVATVGMEVPDTQVTLDVVQSAPISPDYFLEGGTVVFWGITKRPYHSGLFSAKVSRAIIRGMVLASEIGISWRLTSSCASFS